MLTQELKDQVMSLSSAEKAELRWLLVPKAGRATGAQDVIAIMESVLGGPIEKSRQQRFVWARAMVAYQLISEGFTAKKVGQMIDRDHSSVLYLNDKFRNALKNPQWYRDIMPMWKQFQDKIAQYETQR